MIYRTIVRPINDDASSAIYTMKPNNDTGSNYGYQRLTGQNATSSAARAGSQSAQYIGLSGVAQTNSLISDILIYAKSGYERVSLTETQENTTGTTIDQVHAIGQSWNDTSNELTSIVLDSGQTSGMGVDTHAELWRLNL